MDKKPASKNRCPITERGFLPVQTHPDTQIVPAKPTPPAPNPDNVGLPDE